MITHGVASIEGLDAWVQDALNDPRVRAGSRVLVDHRDLDWSPLSHSDIERRAELLARDAPRIGPARVALVARSEADFGLMRMLDQSIAMHEEIVETIRAFRTMEEAREWIESCPPAPEPAA